MWRFLSASLALCATVVSGAPHSTRNNNAHPYVNVKNGTITGIDNAHYGQQMFLGIPYAQPPVGNLRLRPPRPVNASFGDLDASAYGPHCWSAYGPAYDDNSGFPNSEDCLTLNVVRPYGVYNGGKTVPVVFWIHGGGFTTGGSADYRYNSSALVQASVINGSPMVFVSINYRLGSLGFLGGEALANEGSLNLGIRDQRLAMRWVKENIAQFGGDPTKVTIMGESAGGISVHSQVVAYKGQNDGLFHQAIVESGGGLNTYPNASSAPYQAAYNTLLTNSSCSSTVQSSAAAQLKCIRALPIQEFRMFSIGGATGQLRDNDLFTFDSVIEAYEAGTWAKVPFLLSTNTDEGVSFGPKGANTTAQARLAIGNVPEANKDEILRLYPNDPALGSPFNTGDYQLPPFENGAFLTPGLQNKRVAAIVGDVFMQAGARYFAQELSKSVPFYRARFNHIPWTISYDVEDYVGHFTEVSYVFNLQNNDTAFWEENHFTATYLGPGAPIADRFLGDYMSRSWASFISTGDPNNANVSSQVYWPNYADSPDNILFQTQGSMIERDDYREAGIKYIIDDIFLASLKSS